MNIEFYQNVKLFKNVNIVYYLYENKYQFKLTQIIIFL